MHVAIWLALNACGPDTGKDTGTEVRSVDPTTIGDYGVVSRTVNVTSTSGITLPTQLWYPSLSPATSLHRYGDIKESTASNTGVVDCSIERPVVLFSHGNTAMAYQSYYLAEFLTYWISGQAPEYAGNTIFDNDARKQEFLRRPRHL